MTYNSKFKPLIFAVLIVLSVSASFAYTSEFTTSPPETHNINQDFTVSGEVEKDYDWEYDLESIMIQSKAEDSSTWFVEEEKDTGCFGSSCSISSDTISHDTVEDVEYRIVAMNNLGNTIPYSPIPANVQFTEPEREVNFQNLPSDFIAGESYSIQAEATDSAGNLYSERFVLEERKDYGGIGWGSWEEFEDNYCWDASGEECSISGDFNPDSSGSYQLKASITASDGETLTKSEYITVQEAAQDEPALELNSVSASPYTVPEGGETELSAEVQSNHDESSYVTVTWKADGTEIESKGKTVSAGETTTVTKDATYQELRNEGLNTEQDYDLEANLVETTEDIDVTEQASDSLYLEAEEDEPAAEIRSLQSKDTNIEEDEETDFEAEIHANEDLSGLQVDFYVDGEFVEDNDVSLDSGETQTVSNTFSWSELEDQFETGEDHNLEVRLENYKLDSQVSETEENAFFLAQQDQSQFSITDYGPSGDVSSSVDLYVELDNNPSTGWCKFEEGDSVSRYSSTRMAKPDSSEARWSYDQEFSDGTHTVTFQCFNYVRSITGEETTTFSVEEDESTAEIRNLESTDTHIVEDEETNFEAEIHANEDLSGLQVDFYVDGEPVDQNDINMDSGETRTVSNSLSWSDLSDQFETGQDHDLEVRLNNYKLDSQITETEEDAFYLAEGEERSSCQSFSDSDLDVDLENFESIPEEGQEYDASARLDNNGDRDVGGNLGIYVKESNDLANCEFYNDHYSDLEGFTGGNVYPDAGESDSFDFTYYGNPIEDLEYDEAYSLVAIFSDDDTTYIGPAGAIEWRSSDDNGDDDDNDPNAAFSWDRHPVIEDESVEFDASASSDQDDDITQYRWDFNDGSSYNYGQRVDHTFTSTGHYEVELRVRDSNGNTDYRTREVEVVSDPGDCDIGVGGLDLDEYVISEGESAEASVTVDNHGEDQDFTVEFKIEGETVETVSREVSGGSQSTFTASVSPDVDSLITAEIQTEGDPCGSRTYDRTDELTVVGDGDDGDDGDDEHLPQASFSWTPSQPGTEDTVTFDASSSEDEDGDIVEYRWFFGEGNTGYGRTTQHSYGTTGEYDVQLVVEDSEGNTDSITRTVPVVEDPGDCSLTLGNLRFEDSVIESGETTTGSISVSNHGESQRVNIRFKVEGEVVDSESGVVGANSQRTFTSSLSPEVDSLITAEVTTEGNPCGERSYQKTEELTVVGGGASQEATLEVDVRSDSGRRLSNVRVRAQGPESITRYTDTTGEAYLELQEGDYDISLSKSGYQTEVRNLGLNSGDHRSLTVTMERRDSDQGTLVALIEDTEGNRLEDAEITVDGYTRETDEDGRTTVNLDPGTYSATADKPGYSSWTETVHINRGQDTVEVFRLSDDGSPQTGLQITDIDSPGSVCRGDTMTTDVRIENNAGFHEFVTLTGRGLGSINSLRDFSLDEGESVEKTIRFTNVQGSGTEEFTVTANNEDSDSESRTVQVESCGTTATGEPTDISMQLDYTKQPNMAVEGDTLKVNGFVDGANGRSTVEIDVDGETKASVRTQPDGYYQTWITATDVGAKTVRATAGEVSASRPLRVIPTSRVTGLESPVSAFEGQQFQVCANVESQIEPEVILERDGEVVTSKTANGRVCFDQEARDPGMHQYRIAALTSGESNTASTTVETLEMDVEAESFPNQIASVESGSGLVKVDLYNTNDNQTRYDLQLEGLPSTWISQSEKQLILDKGERETVYFYLTPQEEGSYTPTISVDSRGTEIYREELDVITGGTTESQQKGGFFQGVMEGLQNFFTF